ncbi:MAG: prepilin-type N-terminal cleavage/methylation domain-containing protein [Fimbriimonadales bacterium]|nr:prepilin-type N-terminal cleavage/methylation domain-containing protein [Fimbriimonadales bacterium]
MRQRAFTLTELLVSVGLLGLVVGGASALTIAGLRRYANTQADVDVTQSATLAAQTVVESVRQAMSVQIQNAGFRLVYELPALSATLDPTTGERELAEPLRSDGVQRAFSVQNGRLIDESTGRVVARGLVTVDPERSSTQYGQTVPPFQLTTIGSRRAITVNLIGLERTPAGQRYARFKTTFIVRNVQ